MKFTKLLIQNYKKFKNAVIDLNNEINILVGNNESGKSTILEIITLLVTGKINNKPIQFNISRDLFNNEIVEEFISKITKKRNMCHSTDHNRVVCGR